jgi:hypothetical protein
MLCHKEIANRMTKNVVYFSGGIDGMSRTQPFLGSMF